MAFSDIEQREILLFTAVNMFFGGFMIIIASTLIFEYFTNGY